MNKHVISFLCLGLSLGFSVTAISQYHKSETIIYATYENYSPIDGYYAGTSLTGKNGLSGNQKDFSMRYLSSKGIEGLEYVWERYQGTGVTIALIDTGIDVNHPEFDGKIDLNSAAFVGNNVLPGLNNIGHNFVEGNYESHGTNVAGVAAAPMNGSGIVGVAPEANLLILKVDNTQGMANAIRYAADNGAKVISTSLGQYNQPYTDSTTGIRHDESGKDYVSNVGDQFDKAINYALSKNSVVIAAAANAGTDVSNFPASNSGVIGVGALGVKTYNERANFSNFNKENATEKSNNNVDIMAPGYVLTTDYAGSEGNGQSTYTITQGTSFAAPIIAGAAALWFQKHPNGTPDDFKAALYETANDIGDKGWDRYYGYGAIDIYKLMTRDDPQLELNATNEFLLEGKTFELVATLTSESTSLITFESDNENVITIEANGNKAIVTAVGQGKANVIVRCGETTRKCQFTVPDKTNPLFKGYGCGGNIATTSYILSTLALLFIPITFIIGRRKRINK